MHRINHDAYHRLGYRHVRAAVVALVGLCSTAAFAADIPVKAPPVAAYDWSGKLGDWAWREAFDDEKNTARRLRSAIDAVFRTDVDLKRSAAEPRVLLERLVVELCEGRRAAPSRGAPYR